MCLKINNTFHKKSKSLKAKQSILVYKVLEKDNVSKNKYCTPYKKMAINFNEYDGMFFYKNTRMVRSENEYFILNGIHSYFDDMIAKREVQIFKHWYTMHYAVIPKGSKFYIGNDGDIVSTNLVVFRTKKDYLKNKKLFGKLYSLNAYLMDFWNEN